ncbi:MAG: type II toxin-antitoxin system RelE/ParE family toxin [Candidatus Thioglobus sp.]|nr:type II toxin-antitoxin system RelE/ParE family toxin [Candidatus Thioglobus sp.]
MKFEIKRTVKFSKSFKKLTKKYRKLAYDYEKLIDILESGNHNAIKITENIYKIRLKNSSNPHGKSGGFRVIYFLQTAANTIYLLDIFSKTEIDNISKNKLAELAKKITTK